MSDELALAPLNEPGLVITREPEVVLEEAHRAARALQRVIEAKPNKVTFNNEQYLEFEDWCCVGRFYGIAPRITGTRYVEFGPVKGWEATAEAVHVPSQRVVSSADAMCLDDEDKWRSRPKYEWHYVKKSGGTSLEDPGRDELIWEPNPKGGKNRPKKARVMVSDEPVPQFQLRSMAQTRAGAKALRNALAWVVVLAGYRPTPAEEMDGIAHPVETAVSTEDAPPARTMDEAPEDKAAELFPTPEEALRKLRAQVQAGFLVLGLNTDEQVARFQQYCGVTMLEDVKEAGDLQVLLEALRKEHRVAGKRRTSV